MGELTTHSEVPAELLLLPRVHGLAGGQRGDADGEEEQVQVVHPGATLEQVQGDHPRHRLTRPTLATPHTPSC